MHTIGNQLLLTFQTWKIELMTKHWDRIKSFYEDHFETALLILDLVNRVEKLETANELRKDEINKLTDACARLVLNSVSSKQENVKESPVTSSINSLVEQVSSAIDRSVCADEDVPASTGSLVERVTDVISTGRHSEARAAIRAVALWLRRQQELGAQTWAWHLEQEADRG